MNVYEYEVDEEYFNLDKILYGQCFRWRRQDDGKYIGVIYNNVIKIWQNGNMIYFYGYDNTNIKNILYEYFDLKTDYRKVINKIDKNGNKLLHEIIEYSRGTRILNQSMFEILISYIFSASNNILRIERSIEKLSELYGTKVIFEGKDYYFFPTIEQLKNITEKELFNNIKIGYRAPYVADTIKRLYDNEFNLEEISLMKIEDARNKLMLLKGVGPKVADCVMLFSMKKKNVFPIDTWINKVILKYFNKNKLSKKDMQKEIESDFGEYKGIINHYMFYWGRENNIE